MFNICFRHKLSAVAIRAVSGMGHNMADVSEKSTDEILFIKALKIQMTLSGRWIFRNNKSFKIIIYRLYSFFHISFLVLYNCLYFITFIVGYECQYHVPETVSAFFRTSGCLVMMKLLVIKEREDFFTFIKKYEKEVIPYEREAVRNIYNENVKSANKLAFGSIITISILSCIWTVHTIR